MFLTPWKEAEAEASWCLHLIGDQTLKLLRLIEQSDASFSNKPSLCRHQLAQSNITNNRQLWATCVQCYCCLATTDVSLWCFNHNQWVHAGSGSKWTPCVSCSCVSEKLYNSQGPELRRSLFSLKQLFQVTHTHTWMNHLSVQILNHPGYGYH